MTEITDFNFPTLDSIAIVIVSFNPTSNIIELVNIFEKNGFIWGGRWYHYDTMHFEYRPEMFD